MLPAPVPEQPYLPAAFAEIRKMERLDPASLPLFQHLRENGVLRDRKSAFTFRRRLPQMHERAEPGHDVLDGGFLLQSPAAVVQGHCLSSRFVILEEQAQVVRDHAHQLLRKPVQDLVQLEAAVQDRAHLMQGLKMRSADIQFLGDANAFDDLDEERGEPFEDLASLFGECPLFEAVHCQHSQHRAPLIDDREGKKGLYRHGVRIIPEGREGDALIVPVDGLPVLCARADQPLFLLRIEIRGRADRGQGFALAQDRPERKNLLAVLMLLQKERIRVRGDKFVDELQQAVKGYSRLSAASTLAACRSTRVSPGSLVLSASGSTAWAWASSCSCSSRTSCSFFRMRCMICAVVRETSARERA